MSRLNSSAQAPVITVEEPGVVNVNGYGDSLGVGHLSATLYLEQNQSIIFQVFHNNYDAQLVGGSGNTFVQIRKLSN